MRKKISDKKKVPPGNEQKSKPEKAGIEEKELTTEDQHEANESYGGIPTRDLKKNLGCGG
jgi:hypothetical protein